MNREQPVQTPIAQRDLAGHLLFGAIVVCLTLQAWLALVMEINWDEFYFLSDIYSYQHGELTKALQSFQIHLLGWVTRLPGDEIAQIEGGRLFMLACEAGTCVLIYQLARAFFDRPAALVAVLAFVSAGFTMIHGASFRADPIATLFMMAALVVVARAPRRAASAAGAGMLAAVGAMITIKVVLYAPAFLGIAAWRIGKSDDRRSTFLWLVEAAAAAAVGFGILYLIQLGLLPKATNAAARAGLGNAAETQVGAGFLPRSQDILRAIVLSPLTAILLAGGAVAASEMLPRTRWTAVAILGCGASLLCLLFYRNAFPYFFPFILAPAAVLAACAVERIGMLSRHSTLLAAGMTITAAATAFTWSSRDQDAQQELVSAVHRMFPQPVAYIDRNSMIASFPKRGFFMSTWGMLNYYTGPPVFAGLLSRETVPLLIVNGPALEQAAGMAQGPRLKLEDEAALRENYIPHWGRIWIAGKTIEAGPILSNFSIAVPGIYTLEGDSVEIDGKALAPGATVELARGHHSLRAAKAQVVTLRWGDHLYRPTTQPSASPIYQGF